MKSRVIQDDHPEPVPPAPSAPVTGVRATVRAHRVLVFFTLAYVLAWGALPWRSFFAPGALIAALVVAFTADGPDGLRQIGRRLVRWRVGRRWYALALGVPLSVAAATLGLTVVTGAPAPEPDRFGVWFGVPLAIGLAMVNPLNGPLSEEPSFRGYALPLLRRRTPLAAAAVLAVLVTGWHAPLFVLDTFGLRPYEAVTTVAVTFWYVWLFDATGSSFITLIAHAAEGSVDVDGLYPAGSAHGTRAVVANLLLWCAVAVTLLVVHRRYWTGPRRPEPARADPR